MKALPYALMLQFIFQIIIQELEDLSSTKILDLLFRDLIEKKSVPHMLSSLKYHFDTHGHLFILLLLFIYWGRGNRN